jgi:hypothetical protein
LEGILMKLKQAKACVLRVGGTNCDLEIKTVLTELGLNTDVLHMNQAIKRGLSEYQMLVFPADSIWRYGGLRDMGEEVVTRLGKDLERFIDEEQLVWGYATASRCWSNGRPTQATARLRAASDRRACQQQLREVRVPVGPP